MTLGELRARLAEVEAEISQIKGSAHRIRPLEQERSQLAGRIETLLEQVEERKRKYTKAEILESLLDGLINVQNFNFPQLDDNYLSAISQEPGKDPVLYISLKNGQHFEVRARVSRGA